MRNHGLRRVVSLVLAVMMVCTLLPTAALADEALDPSPLTGQTDLTGGTEGGGDLPDGEDIVFDTLYEQGEYEVLASFYDRVYYEYETNFKFYRFLEARDPADFGNAMENFQKKRLYDTGVTASFGDRLITLVTCTHHTQNGRFVVVARKK